MKLRWMCRCAKAVEKTTKPICGSTVDPEGQGYLTSVWAAVAMDRSSFWDNSKGFCKRTAMQLTFRSAGRRWFMLRVELMEEDTFLRQCSSILKMQPRHRSWHGWMNYLPSTPRLVTKDLTMPGAMLCVRKRRDR